MSERHSMRKIREVLRLKYEVKLTHREISAAVVISRSTVSEYVVRAQAAGVTWAVAEELSDAELEGRLFEHVGRNEPESASLRAPIDFGWVHLELRRPNVTLQLLWTEYQAGVKAGGGGKPAYQYSQFCDLYREFRDRLAPTMRQVHRAGEKGFIDFSGRRPRIFDPATGETTEVELYLMVLGASSYTYAEATRSQKLEDFTGATVRGLEYFGGAPEMLVPDQLRSAVKTPDWFEPEINATFADLGRHYNTAIVPARPGKPRDKAKVEGGVLIAQRWILACLRDRKFFSLEELNTAIRELLEKLNHRPFQKLEGSRRSTFERLDQPVLKPLPARRYELGRWKHDVGVNIDYHVEYDHRYYSIDCELIHQRVDIRATDKIVELWRGTTRLTSHERSYGPKGTAVTKQEHRPRSHRELGEWPPERLIAWAGKSGPSVATVAESILARGQHPEAGRRACLALIRMAERFGAARLESACARAIAIGSPTRKSVEAILKSGLDKTAMPIEVESLPVVHDNIRGADYYDRQATSADGDQTCDADIKYLEEERMGIKNDSSFDASQVIPQASLEVGASRAASSGDGAAALLACSTRRPAVQSTTLTAVIERLQGLWSRPEGLEARSRDYAANRGTKPSLELVPMLFTLERRDDYRRDN